MSEIIYDGINQWYMSLNNTERWIVFVVTYLFIIDFWWKLSIQSRIGKLEKHARDARGKVTS